MTAQKQSSGAIDPRIEEARDSVLGESEQVIAQEVGDQGQAIILTDSRILIIKVGIAAAGSIDGRTIGDFPLSEVTAANLRKGPVGAVIHIVTRDRGSRARGAPLDNVVIFTGPERVKRCEAIAATIESCLGRPVGRIEAGAQQPEKPKQAEPSAPETKPASSDFDAVHSVVEAVQASTTVAPLEQDEQHCEEEEADHRDYRPNPNLPKPVRKSRGPAAKVLVLVGLLMAALLVGMGITRPAGSPGKPGESELNIEALTESPALLARQQADIANYRTCLRRTLAPCKMAFASLAAALKSGSRQALNSGHCEKVAYDCWRRVGRLPAPPGAAQAKDQILAGTFALKTAAGLVSVGLQSSGPLDVRSALQRIQEGQDRIDRGFAVLDTLESELNAQISRRRSGS